MKALFDSNMSCLCHSITLCGARDSNAGDVRHFSGSQSSAAYMSCVASKSGIVSSTHARKRTARTHARLLNLNLSTHHTRILTRMVHLCTFRGSARKRKTYLRGQALRLRCNHAPHGLYGVKPRGPGEAPGFPEHRARARERGIFIALLCILLLLESPARLNY